MNGQPPISIRDLSVYYGDLRVLKDINLDIPAKRITVIIGPSGCGKTTLLKSLNRLLDTDEGARVRGEVLLDGENIYAGPPGRAAEGAVLAPGRGRRAGDHPRRRADLGPRPPVEPERRAAPRGAQA